jgi:cell division protein FtsX
MKKSIAFLRREFIRFGVIVLGCLLCALALNAYYQSWREYASLMRRATIAVFVLKNAPQTTEMIEAKIREVEEISDVSFISPERSFDIAGEASAKVKDIIITGENPFTSFFSVRLKDPGVEHLLSATSRISALEGVDEVRYDTALFNAIDRLKSLCRFYGFSLSLLALLAALLSAAAVIRKWMHRKTDPHKHIVAAIEGTVCGIIAAGIYAAMSSGSIPTDAVRIPLSYLALLLPAGMLIGVLWEK